MDIPPKVREAYNLYKKNVGLKMASAFRNDVKQPHMDTLVAVASACGFTGSPNDVLTALAPHMKRERDRMKLSYEIEDRDLPPGNTPDHNPPRHCQPPDPLQVRGPNNGGHACSSRACHSSVGVR